MTEHVYETLFILDTEQYSRNPEEVSGQIAKAIEELGGTVRVSRVWDEDRKLAYEIDGHKRGTYWLVYYRLDTEKTKDLNRQFQLMNPVVRFLTITIDERLEEALVNHALNPPKPAEPETKAPAGDDVFAEDETDDDEAQKEQ
ncbi:MAG: 30S ribosomal protein S6 [Thermoguttaceae bacterium]|nr:30S ribosomal protein S6 [Thermoguttaceae bacterium]